MNARANGAATAALDPDRASSAPLVSARGLRTGFRTARGVAWAVDGVDLDLSSGRTLGVVGESGSGKTMLGRSIMQLLPRRNVERRGSVTFEGVELTTLDQRALRHIWGANLSMVFQDPMTSLNPVVKIGRQITESLRFHRGMSGTPAEAAAIELLRAVHLPDPERRIHEYPHQLSGGLRQRVSIAVALACGPRLLIADEPTTSLDVTIQAQILDLLGEQQQAQQMAMLLITHDLGVVAQHSDEIAVMYAGQIVEQAPTAALFSKVRMPYTEALLRAMPRVGAGRQASLAAISGRPPSLIGDLHGCRFAARCQYVRVRCRAEAPPLLDDGDGHRYRCWYPVSTPAMPEGLRTASPGVLKEDRSEAPVVQPVAVSTKVEVASGQAPAAGSRASESDGDLGPHLHSDSLLRLEHLVVEFPIGRGRRVQAVSDLSLDVVPGETLGLVGESGCGKSTTGRAIMQLLRPTSGRVLFDGQDLTAMDAKALRLTRPSLQMVFQDPISSLNPRRRVEEIVAEPMQVWKQLSPAAIDKRVEELLATVGFDPAEVIGRRPFEFSGGQCQRISIARALSLEPQMLICDEPVSALDVSVQAQIINLLEEMKRRYQLTMVFISHDLAVVENVSDRIAVMYLGKLCEVAEAEALYAGPAHHYTAALLSAIPLADPGAPKVFAGGVGGEPPSPLAPPSGCRFRTRCPAADARCATEEPAMRKIGEGHFVACHHPIPSVLPDVQR